ncbi:MAG TPA: hypothetical protein VEM41_11220 [Actinomycetota bacterium]|nr:hypothetical protein [Actinomycetota bacterium]
MEPDEIFELIVKADERLKYATGERAAQRREQARQLLEQAKTEAAAIGNAGLVAQADRRLADVAALPDVDGPGATAEA